MKKYLLNLWYTLLYQFDQHRNEIPDWWYDNKPFENCPKHIQRIRIAEDVIAQIEIKRYRPGRGSYMIDFKFSYSKLEDDVQSNFENIRECTVCGLGACLLSGIKFKNSFSFSDLNTLANTLTSFTRNIKVQTLLSSIFSKRQLLLIEAAFEMTSGISFLAEELGETDVYTDDVSAAAYFGRTASYFESDIRLKAIMRNIVENRGTFKP